MSGFQAFADSLDVVVRNVGGHVVDRFERTGAESREQMDAKLMSLGYQLEGDWWSEKQGGNWVYYRRLRK